MKLSKINFLFLLITLLAFILRFYKLGSIPFSLDWDEVSNGYNAYSILKTGRDEYGNFLPLTNRSFDDYKPPLYMYLTIPSVAIFGLNEFAVRLPSALFGFLTVPLFYILAKRFFSFLPESNSKFASYSAMFLLAISPWHLQFSRVGFEANVALFFTTLGLTLFLYSFKKGSLLIPSSFFLSLSVYAYHSQKIFIPLICILLSFIYRDDLLKLSKKYTLSFCLIAGLMIIPLVLLAPKQAFFSRYQTASSEQRRIDAEKSSKYILEDNKSPLGRLIHSRKVIYAFSISQNYLENFDFNFLFTKGDDNARHHLENMGMFYLFQMPLMLIGLFTLFKKINKLTLTLLALLVVAPVPSAVVFPAPHAIRSLLLIVPLEIIAALGLAELYFQKFYFRKLTILIFTFWILISIIVYFHIYYVHYPVDKADVWQYGYKEAVIESAKVKNSFDHINISPSIEDAYVYWLFYTKHDPKNYQIHGSNSHFDKFYFNSGKPESPKDLFVSSVDTPIYPKDFKVIKDIHYPNGKPAINLAVHP